jgi:hypothetical protein
MKCFLRGFLGGAAIAVCVLVVIAAVPAMTSFNTNQFSTVGNNVAIKSAPAITNLTKSSISTTGTWAAADIPSLPASTITNPAPTTIFSGNWVNAPVNTGVGKGVSLVSSGSASVQTWSGNVEKGLATQLFRAGTFSNLTFRVLTSPGGPALGVGTNITFILYTNNVQSTFVLTLTADGAQIATNSGTAFLAVPANSACSWRITNSLSGPAADVAWSVEFY